MASRSIPRAALVVASTFATALACSASEGDDPFTPPGGAEADASEPTGDSGAPDHPDAPEPNPDASTADPGDGSTTDSGEPEPGDTGTPDPEPTQVCGKPAGFPRNDSIPEPVFTDEVNVSSTIVIDKPGVYDFDNVLHVWTGSGSCNQTENQPYILRIAASDVTLKNFAYRNAPDGIHIGTANDGQGYSYGDNLGNIVLDNVVGWACEDALTTQYGVEDLTITNSIFFANPNPNYRDKLLQLNFGDATIENSTFVGSDTCVMFKGDQHVVVRNSRFIDCDRGINGSTIHGVLGEIGTGPSTLETECNESYYAERAWKFWGGFKLATAYADVVGTSVNDLVYDNGFHEAQDGGTVSASCHPDIMAAALCGPVRSE